MTRRVTGALMWTLILTVVFMAMTGCTRTAAPSSNAPTATPTISLAPSPVSPTQTRGDAALAAAVRFEQRHCAWTWRSPLAVYIAAQQSLTTAAYGRQLAAQTDPVAWRKEVVAGQQVVTCTITAAHRLVGAPSTSTNVYTRMSVTEQVSSRMGSFSGGQRIVSWLVQRVAARNGGARWLVAGTFDGG